MEPLALIILAVALLLPLYLLFVRASDFPSLPGPPWYDYLPGGLAHTLYSDMSRTMHTLLALARRHGDTFSVVLGPRRTIVTADPADIVHVVSNRADFDRTPAMQSMFETAIPGSLLTMPREAHLRARRHLRGSFNHSMLPSFHGRMQDAIAELCVNLTAAASNTQAAEATAEHNNNDKTSPGAGDEAVVDVTKHLSSLTFRAILAVAFGIPTTRLSAEQRADFAHRVDALIHELLAELIGYPVRQMLTPLGVRDNYLRLRESVRASVHQFVEDRHAESDGDCARRASDLLDAILELGEGGGAGDGGNGETQTQSQAQAQASSSSTSTVTSQAALFALAGAHTTSLSIAWTLYQTCQDARVTARIRAEVDAVAAEARARKAATTPSSSSGSEGGDGDGDGADADVALTFEDVGKLRYLSAVFKEAMRLVPPAGYLFRCAQRDVTLRGSGVQVAKGTQVVAFYRAAMVSERTWKEPDAFIPERWLTPSRSPSPSPSPSGEGDSTASTSTSTSSSDSEGEDDEHKEERRKVTGEGARVPAGACVPFSAGSRNCAGQFFAEYEAVLVLAELHRQFTFRLGCAAEDVVACSGYLEVPKSSSKGDGKLDMGLPMIFQRRDNRTEAVTGFHVKRNGRLYDTCRM